ncbi:acyl-CoA dehydrogenase family protein [Ferrovibrio sp.]|uniref:acyl-CoA dehydrogenase family protein n=1 Tax=Ferrovibrio sp. TaxID=1917215 RepID=UPI003D146989
MSVSVASNQGPSGNSQPMRYDPEAVLDTPELRELNRLAIEEFRPRGRAYDKNCDIPIENIKALHERGWLGTTVSKSLGGKESNLDAEDKATYLQALRSIARGCPGTAHCYQVHNHTMWIMEKLGTPRQIDKFVKPTLKEGLLTAFVGSEAKRRHMYMMNTTAKKVPGGWIVHGEKNYATNGAHMGFAIIFAAIEGVKDYLDNHLMVVITPDMKGVSMDHTWYRPNGMRAAPSPVITLDQVFVPDENILSVPGAYPRGRWQGKYHLGFTANYLGTTEGMYGWFVDYIKNKGRTKDPIIQMRAGEVRIALDSARASFHRAISSWTDGDVTRSELLSMAAKSMAAHVAFEASHKLVHAAGSTALFDEHPLSRYIADLETHVLHAGHDRTAQIIGSAELGEAFDSTLQR